MLAVAAIVADTQERAEALGLAHALSMARLRTNNPGPLPSPQEAAEHHWTQAERQVAEATRRFVSVGTPDQVAEDLRRKAARATADELIVTTNVHDPAERIRSYELLASAFGLGG